MSTQSLTRPMSEFQPAEPALLHNRLNDEIIPWTGELKDEWLRFARPRDDGTIEWGGRILDGWDDPLGG